MQKLSEVLPQVESMEKRHSRISMPSRELRITEEGRIRAENQTLRISKQAERILSNMAGIPPEFYLRLPPHLKAVNFNTLYQQECSGDGNGVLRLHLLDGKEVIGISESHLCALENTRVIRTVLEAIPELMSLNREDLLVSSFDMTHTSLEINVHSPDITLDPRPGDTVNGGISIFTSSTGQFSTQITSYLHRLVCSNGMLIPVLEESHRLRIKRAKRDSISGQYILRKIGVIAALAWMELDVKLQALRELAQHVIQGKDVLKKIAHDLHLNKGLQQELSNAFEMDGSAAQGTQYDVMNALSWATHSQHLTLIMRRRVMSEVGLILSERIERCPHCQSILRRQYEPVVN